jgi:enamine deaminase RidA (YjgF/YER057c/UK114 family)
MELFKTNDNFPISAAVSYRGRILETVITGIPAGSDGPIQGGAAEEMREIFRQLDEVLALAGLTKSNICSARLYLEHVNRDIGEVNEVYCEYFAGLAPNRRAYGVDLQVGMLVEAAFVAEFPED